MTKEKRETLILDLKAIIACNQNDGYYQAWAKKKLKRLEKNVA